MKKRLLSSLILILAMGFSLFAGAQSRKRLPAVDDLLNVKQAGGAQISPDGNRVAFTVSETDFKQDAFITQIWMAEIDSGRVFQLTRGDKPAGNPQWSPSADWLAFTSSRIGGKNQIFAIRMDAGEAVQLTKAENGVSGFAWSDDGRNIAFTASDIDAEAAKNRKDYLGDYEVIRKEYDHTQIWTFDFAAALKEPVTGSRRTMGKDFSVTALAWSPDASRIAFSATINPDLINGGTADIYLLSLADNSVKKIVAQPGPDNNPRWSPDGKQIVFSSAMGNPKYFHSNARLAVVPAEGGTPRSITDGFDEQPGLIDWNADGIYFSGSQKTAAHLFRVDPATARTTRLSRPDTLIASGFTFSRDGKRIAFGSSSPTSLNEIFTSDLPDFAPRRVTAMTDQVKEFNLATREVISWKSQDGTAIEGILIKPADFDPARKYPLLCIIHGGPTGIDRPTLLDARYYPADIWAGRGALVLKVNYRGSAGYGEKFRQLNVRNLGVGDAWDVISGVDFLIDKGWVDRNKVGCMGWSQGGYISAFLTASSDRFAAISVGAGISDWGTSRHALDRRLVDPDAGDLADDPRLVDARRVAGLRAPLGALVVAGVELPLPRWRPHSAVGPDALAAHAVQESAEEVDPNRGATAAVTGPARTQLGHPLPQRVRHRWARPLRILAIFGLGPASRSPPCGIIGLTVMP